MVRRLIAVGVFLAVLFLILLVFRACQDARKDRGLDNYVRDLTAIADGSSQLSAEFFGRLNDPGELTPQTLADAVATDESSAQSLLQRVQDLSTPEQMAGPQSQIRLAFELRRDALASIAAQLPAALGGEGSADQAVETIAGDMRQLLAGDVIYAHARREIEKILAAEGVSSEDGASAPPVSNFLPEPVADWIDELEVGSKLALIAGVAAGSDGAIHGVGILQTEIRPGPVILIPDTPNTITVDDSTVEIHVSVDNQGTADETELAVSFELTGTGFSDSGDGTIPKIAPGESKTVVMTLGENPPIGSALTLTVRVLPVIGEAIAENNESSYPITVQ